MQVNLAYGKDGLAVELPEHHASIVEPAFVPGLVDEQAAITAALRSPIKARPLRDLVGPTDTVAVVFPDVTRPCPSDRLLPPLLAELAAVPRARIVLLSATGMHRANTPDELRRMVGPAIAEQYRIVNHDAQDAASLAYVGTSSHGNEIWVNREYLQASVRILVGFIEPHLFAGFSGGGKAILPGIAGAATVMRNHGAAMIGNPQSTWGITAGNPIFMEMREAGRLAQPTFILNVALNQEKAISGVFAGEMVAAHDSGIDFVRATSMRAVPAPFDIVITTNSGYPLDLNLYQSVKGMSAAARIIKPGGAIIAVAECSDGIPAHGFYREILHRCSSPSHALELISRPDFCQFDQWEVQIQAMVQLKADVYLYSTLDDAEVRAAMLEPIHSVEETVRKLSRAYGPQATIAVMPVGPFTIPYVER